MNGPLPAAWRGARLPARPDLGSLPLDHPEPLSFLPPDGWAPFTLHAATGG